MNWSQIAENWNERVSKLCNWSINRLEGAADKGDAKTARPDCLPSESSREHAGQEEYHEIEH